MGGIITPLRFNHYRWECFKNHQATLSSFAWSSFAWSGAVQRCACLVHEDVLGDSAEDGSGVCHDLLVWNQQFGPRKHHVEQ